MLQVISTKPLYSQEVPNIYSQFSKCGEIHVNDASTEISLYCSFCTKEDIRVLKTLSEFMEHIKWHRSEDFSLSIKDDNSEQCEAVKIEVATDLIDSPSMLVASDSEQAKADSERCEEDLEDIPNDVLVKVLDLYKKCPCLWHKATAAEDEHLVEPTYRMLANQYNTWSGQSKSMEYVRDFVEKIKDGFLIEFTVEEDISSSSPWYFPHLMFLLIYEENTIDESIYTDLLCPICTQESCSQQDLWKHIHQCHLRLDDVSLNEDESPKPQRDPSLSRELTERFLEIYKEQRRLWDKRNIEYHNRPLRNDSYKVLLSILQEHHPEATISDVINKIKYFRQQFATERRKIIRYKRLGVVYESRSWYYKHLQFLFDDVVLKGIKKQEPSEKSEYKISDPNCHICEKTFEDQTSWLDHLQCAHDTEDFQSADSFFYCPICSLQKKTKYALIRHLRQMHTKNDKTCHDCGTSFRFMSALAKHRADVHNDHNPFKCNQCGKGFVSLTRMKIHIVTHWNVEDRPHVCTMCNSKFSNRANLNVHIKRHTRDFRYQCKVCNHLSATATELRFHTFTHTKKYPAICDVCGKGFRSPSMLSNHKIECHNDLLFQCDMCKKLFKSMKKLQSHYTGHRGTADQECEICGDKFRRKAALHKHLLTKHAISTEQ